MESTSDEVAATREALDKVTKEMDELQGQISKIRGENSANLGFAFGFNPGEFNSLNYTKGLAWIAGELAVKVKRSLRNFRNILEWQK